MAHHSIDIGMQNMYSKSFIWAFPIGSIPWWGLGFGGRGDKDIQEKTVMEEGFLHFFL